MKKGLTVVFALIFAFAIAQAQYYESGKSATTPAPTPSQPVSTSAAKPGTADSKAAKTETGVDKTADIKTLLSLTRAGELAVQMMQEMLNSYRQSLPQVPEKFWLGFAKKIKSEDLVNMLAPIYDRHLTHTEVSSLIEFFQSPLGQKLVSVQPEIMKESMQVGQAWGEKIGNEVVAELQKQGYR